MKHFTFSFRFVVLSLLALSFAGCGINKSQSTKEGPRSESTRAGVRVSPQGKTATEPVIGADGSGNLFVAYVERSGKSADLYLQKLDKGGAAVGERAMINPNPGEVKTWAGDPPTLAFGKEGTIFVGWTRSLTDPSAKGNDLVLSVSVDGGRSFAAPLKINDDEKPASHGMHSLTVDTNGRIIVAWLDERNIKADHTENMASALFHHEDVEPNSEVFYSTSDDGGKTFTPNKKIASDVCPCCKTFLAAGDDGTVYMSWRQVLKGDYRHIAVASTADGGKTFSNAVIVSDDQWQLNACPISGAAIVSSGPQTLDVLWYTAGKAGAPGLYSARSTDGGKTFSPRKVVDSEAIAGSPTLLSTADKVFAVFKQADDKIVSTSANTSTVFGPVSEQARGLAPSAIVADGKLITAFIENSNSRSEIWVVSE